VAAYYYLRILVVMYMKDSDEKGQALAEASRPAGAALQFAVYAAALGTLLLGIFPGWVLDVANRAALK